MVFSEFAKKKNPPPGSELQDRNGSGVDDFLAERQRSIRTITARMRWNFTPFPNDTVWINGEPALPYTVKPLPKLPFPSSMSDTLLTRQQYRRHLEP
jgi:hypothetical protein